MKRTACAPIVAGVLAWGGASPLMAEPQPTTRPAATQPVAEAQITTSDLMQELRQMRRQMEEQQQQHDKEIAALRAELNELRSKSAVASSAPSSDTQGAATSRDASGSEAGTASPEDELADAISQAGGGTSAPNRAGGKADRPSGASSEDELENAITQSTGPAPAASTPVSAAPLSLQGAGQSFNPDISINGDFLAAYSNREGGQLDDEFLFREAEIGFTGAVDPYTSATLIVTVGREDNEFKADLEEGYLSFLGLPYDLQARVGQFRSEFGKANPTHLHALPWTDYPLVVKRYFGPDGLSGAGAEVSWLVPNPAKKYILINYEIINNDNDSLFAGAESDDFAHIVHLKSFFDLSPTSTLEVGGSFAEAPNTEGHGSHRSMIEGFDLTYRWKPKDAGLYRQFLWQNELLFAQADLINGQETTCGGYSAADYQFARQWKVGVRYDNTQLPFSSSFHEHGYSAYLTFLQSEFVFWRLGYLITDRNFPQDGNEDEQQLFLQLNWTLGAHPAHRY